MSSKTGTARTVFSSDRYACEVTGIQIDHVGEHTATCSLHVDARHRNARNTVMGGVLFTLADFCAAVAANSETMDCLQWVSLDSTIHFLSPALGDSLKVTCTALKTGRSTALYQSIIESPDNGKTVAIVETTMIHV